jgi:hypothetical protein
MGVEGQQTGAVGIGGEGPSRQGQKAQACESQDEWKSAAQYHYPFETQRSECLGQWEQEKAGGDPEQVDMLSEAYK